jgi:hypothetical protein
VLEQAAAELVAWAAAQGLPIVVEALDFAAKRARLRELPAGMARMLSGFADRAWDRALRACARRHGVWVWAVNPAWTSILGALTLAVPLGLSVHHAAAATIGRRAMERWARGHAAGHDHNEIARALLSGARAMETPVDAVPTTARLPGGHLTPVASVLPETLQSKLPAGRRQALLWHASRWRAALAARRQGRAPPARATTIGPAVAPGAIPGEAPKAARRGDQGRPQRQPTAVDDQVCSGE